MNQTVFFQRFLNMEPKLGIIARARLASRQDAEDAVQDTFIKAWMHSGDLRDDDTFDAWLVRICLNTCVDMVRMQRRRRESCLYEEAQLAATQDSILERLWLQSLFYSLSDRCRDVMIAFYIEGLTVRETALRYNRSEGTIKSWLFSGRKAMSRMSGRE